MAIESPPYSVVGTHQYYEVRRYEPYLVAETVVRAGADDAGNQGFRILAGYIFGRNRGERRIAMTAPVAQTPVEIPMTAPVMQAAGVGGYAVQFALPREYTLETLPVPIDPGIALRAMPSRTVAVISYSGTWSQGRYEEHLGKLQEMLKREKMNWHGEPIWARYDPPWTLWFLRRNEIWLELD